MLQVTCAIIEHEGRVLITQRSESMPDPLLWEFPGGKIEPGETEEECLVREIKEELNLYVQPLRHLTSVLHQTQTKTIQLIPFLCSLRGGDIQLLEHRAFNWVLPEDLRTYDWCLPDLPVVEEYLQQWHRI
ncbi:(deoxy)nucleoside triphosphate pyrophosphohydrolase [Pontibacter pamirensis]|uniref:(deoxy)nucleoside triphosphate pyrophosphohydrolase n=1 Tax=Pontibacter pamirensis TaxID=2562824 RepID=UPI001389CFCC|nr:(deoxy)nucleoside triphosphate pyrophosphohydrolase [Pontibacter pamirensis]